MNKTPPHNQNHRQDDKQDDIQEDIVNKWEQSLPTETATGADPELDKLTEEELLKKVIEYRGLSQRLTADYQNLKKETDQRLASMSKYANANLLEEIVPAIDYFNSAFAHVPESDRNSSWLKGVQHIQDYLWKVLRDHNVTPITTVGQQFNPELHEAVGEEDSDQPDNTIIREAQAGFMLNDKVLRHAKVIVKKAEEEKIDNQS